jgi:phage-related protein
MTLKPLVWVGSSREDLRTFPEGVRFVMGYALYLAQADGKHPNARPLHGFGGLYGSIERGRLRPPCVPEEVEEGHGDAPGGP